MTDRLTARVQRDLARMLRAQGLSDKELAERAGVSAARRLAHGLDMTLSELAVLARALGADVEVRLTPKRAPRTRGDLRTMVGLLRAAMSRSHDPMERYAAGEIIRAAMRAPEAYGDRAVSTLAEAVGEDVPSLYRFASVAESFTRAEAKRLLGKGLTWSHLVALAQLPDAKRRKAWAKRAVRGSLSVRALQGRLPAPSR